MKKGRGFEAVVFISLLALLSPACGDKSSASDNAGGKPGGDGGASGKGAGGSSAADNAGRASVGDGGSDDSRAGRGNAGHSNGGATSTGGAEATAGSEENGGVAGTAGDNGNAGEGGAPSAAVPSDPRCAQALASALQGSGTSDDPYLICLPLQLQLLGADPYTLDRAYQLGNDLDLAMLSTPLDTIKWTLNGTFDGRSHSIFHVSNVLFVYVDSSGVVQDLNVSGTVNSAQSAVATGSRGTFRRVRVSGTFTFGNHAGPLIGDNQGLVEDCSSSGTVESTGPHVGGLIGSNTGTVRRSFSTANVTGALRVGGLVGTQRGGTIEESYALGSVSAPSSVGGLVGSHFAGEIRNCYARSPMVNGTDAGGLVGQVGDQSSNAPILIVNSYSTSTVSGTGAEGLVGFVSNTNTVYTITSSYFIDTATGMLGTPLTSAQLKLASSYTGWSFDSIWKMDPKLSEYPSLAFEAR